MGKYNWVNTDRILSKIRYDSSEIVSTDPIIKDTMSFKEIKKYNPTNFFEMHERWCPHCKNCETSVKNLNKISKTFNKRYVQTVLRTIIDNKLSKFTVRDIIKSLHAEDITNGDLQRQALVILSCLGYVKKEVVEYKNKKGEDKIKYIFELNNTISPCKCYNLIKDRHLLDWDRESTETKYFWREMDYEKQESSR